MPGQKLRTAAASKLACQTNHTSHEAVISTDSGKMTDTGKQKHCVLSLCTP